MVLLGELQVSRPESIAAARTVSEKIRASLAAPYLLNISLQHGVVDGLVENCCSVSIGVTVFINHEVSQHDILKRADAAMYQAKEAGRDTIRFYESQDGP